MENLIIVGLSSTAKHVLSFVRSYNLYNVIGFAVNAQYKTCDTYEGLPVYTLENLREECQCEFKVFVALLWNHLNRDRKSVYDYCKSQGYVLANLISPNANVRGEIKGDNCWVHDFVVIQNNACIQSDVIIMAYTLIGANSVVEPHCFFGARSLMAGGCHVGEQTFVGINATIFDDTMVGKKCIVGACAVVKRHMPDFSKCSTGSDHIVVKQYQEDEVEEKLVFYKNIR